VSTTTHRASKGRVGNNLAPRSFKQEGYSAWFWSWFSPSAPNPRAMISQCHTPARLDAAKIVAGRIVARTRNLRRRRYADGRDGMPWAASWRHRQPARRVSIIGPQLANRLEREVFADGGQTGALPTRKNREMPRHRDRAAVKIRRHSPHSRSSQRHDSQICRASPQNTKSAREGVCASGGIFEFSRYRYRAKPKLQNPWTPESSELR
jgi:hypothetical protein